MQQAGKRNWWPWVIAGVVVTMLGCGFMTLVLGGATFWFATGRGDGDSAPAVQEVGEAPVSASPMAVEAPPHVDPYGRMSMAAVPDGWDSESDFGVLSGYVAQMVRTSPDLEGEPGLVPNLTVLQTWPQAPDQPDPQALVDRPWASAEEPCTNQGAASFDHPRLGSGHVVRWVDCSDAAEERIRAVFPQGDGSVLQVSATIIDDRDRDYYRQVLDTLEFQPAPAAPTERVCSSESGDNLPFNMTNSSSEPVRIFWYGSDCSAGELFVLPPGETGDSDGPPGREWRAFSIDGTRIVSAFTGPATADANWDIR